MSVNIIGAGLAGLSAALTLAEHGVPSRLLSVQPSERAQSVMAEGGINACLNTMGEQDTVAHHFEDTMRGGVYLADPNAVWGLCAHAPAVVEKLAALGVPFERNENGIVQRNFGGQKKKRTAYVKSSTGKMLMTALTDAVRRYEAAGLVTRCPHHRFLKLQTVNNACAGVVAEDIYSGAVTVFGGSVILATGGLNGLFDGMTTGSTQNTGDVTAAVFAQGVRLANAEMIQYHPTTVQIQGKRLLISEAARGEGGRLFVRRGGKPWYFMEEKYPELKNLMPRDVVSAEITAVTAMPDCENVVYLDMTGIGKAIWKSRLSDLREQCLHYLHLDPSKTPVPVMPGIHYFMGGIWVDEQHRTSMPHLYAAGECACQYHGANRLGGNSLLGAVYGGMTAAQTAAANPLAADETKPGAAIPFAVSPAFAKQVKDILAKALPIVRREAELQTAIHALHDLLRQAVNGAERNRVRLALAAVMSAEARRESRGAHKRVDYPDRNDAAYQKQTLAEWRDGAVHIRFADIPHRRDTHDSDG